jgi:molybdopterin-guanine dinucleotide biosynthesis protein B
MENSYLNKKPVISVVSSTSNSGKTTLIEGIVKVLKSRGYEVGVIKYDVREFQIDYPGKDSYRFTEAGADNVVIASDNKMAMIKKLHRENSIDELLVFFKDADIIIVEGFKDNEFPKIEVYRRTGKSQLLYKNPEYNFTNIVAIVSTEKIQSDIPVFNLNDTDRITGFIEKNFMGVPQHE